MPKQDLAILVGARNVGLAVARRVVGRRLIITDADESALHMAAATMRARGFDVDAICLDAADPTGVSELVRLARSGTVCNLIVDTTAGAAGRRIEDVLRHVLIGPALVLDAFAPLAAAGASGVVICDDSARDAVIDPFDEEALALMPVARLPKMAIAAPQRFRDVRAARAFAMRGIQLRTRAANAMWTHRSARVNSLTVGALGSAGCALTGVAAVGAFLLSDESRCIAGADIVADGGASVADGFDGEVAAGDFIAASGVDAQRDPHVAAGDLSNPFTRF